MHTAAVNPLIRTKPVDESSDTPRDCRARLARFDDPNTEASDLNCYPGCAAKLAPPVPIGNLGATCRSPYSR